MPAADPYDALGQLIHDESPYGSDTGLPALDDPDVDEMDDRNAAVKIRVDLYRDNHVLLRSGLHRDNDAAHPSGFKPNADLTQDEMREVLYWTSEGVEYPVTKTLRIWYTYKAVDAEGNPVIDPETKQQRVVGTFLLVGYVGNGQP